MWWGETLMKKNLASRAIDTLREEGMRPFFRKTSAYVAKKLEFLALPYALLRIKGLNRDCTLNELLDFTFNDCAGLIKPAQVYDEVSGLLKIVNEIEAKVILEIGTANGGTLFLFSHVTSGGATMISIDLPGGRFGGGYPAWRTLLYKSFVLPGQKMYLLRADSHKRDTLEQVKAILSGRDIDFLFIDGDHTYEGVKRDFEMYSTLVRKRGIIALHDIVPAGWESVGGVPQFWSEVKSYYQDEEREIVQDRSQGGFGIGLLYVTMVR
jgi:predicted O-methyltransferase YrrM